MVSADTCRQAGFTLVELVVVLTLIGLMAALAVPAMRPLVPSAPYGHELLRAMEMARSDAARSGRPVELWIDTRNGSYRELPNGAGEEWMAPGSASIVSDSASEAGGWRRVVFDPTGRSTGGRMKVFTDSRQAVTLSIDPWTGRVRVVGLD